MKMITGAAAFVALGAVGAAHAETSEAEILRMFIPAEISLVKDGDEYAFQSDLAVPFYISDDDEPGISHCTGTCTETWWPVRAKKSDARAEGAWSLIERDDGRPQWAYKGQPIYYYLHDEPGKSEGDGIDGKWHVLKP